MRNVSSGCCAVGRVAYAQEPREAYIAMLYVGGFLRKGQGALGIGLFGYCEFSLVDFDDWSVYNLNVDFEY